jgi:hypothetical protein
MFSWLWPFGRKQEEAVCTVPPEPVTPPPVLPPAPAPKPAPGDPYYVYRPLFDLFGKSEGTDKGDGYNETLGYGAMLDGVRTKGKGKDVSLVTMTLAEIDALQTKMLTDPDNARWNSSAVGRYQIVRTTLRKIKKAAGLADTVLFNEKTQDYCCLHLLEGRGLSKYLAGTMSENVFLNNLAKEWASIPTTSGKGYYGNQSHTPVTPAEVRAVLAEVKRRFKG